MKKYLSLLLLCLCFNALAQQEQDSIATKQLKEVIVSSTRIDFPLSENARSIQVISKSLGLIFAVEG
jgi:hypothetical protein